MLAHTDSPLTLGATLEIGGESFIQPKCKELGLRIGHRYMERR